MTNAPAMIDSGRGSLSVRAFGLDDRLPHGVVGTALAERAACFAFLLFYSLILVKLLLL